jgi:hypothetical protein
MGTVSTQPGPEADIRSLPNATAEDAPLRRGITLLCCFPLNADQSGLTYLHGSNAFEALSIFLSVTS